MKRAQHKPAVERAIIYARVSSDRQTHNQSLPQQEAACKEWCANNGFVVDCVFVEEGKSAKTAERPAFQNALRYVKQHRGRIQAFVVFHSNRFARNTWDDISVCAELKKNGVRVRSVTDDWDDTATGRAMHGISAVMNTLQNETHGENVSAKMRHHFEQGEWVAPLPLGYARRLKADGKKEIIQVGGTAEIVGWMFEEYAAGKEKADILRRATLRGLRTRKGNPLSVETFCRMLTNPVYAGIVRVPKYGIDRPGNWKAIVPSETWLVVQRRLRGLAPNAVPHLVKHPTYPAKSVTYCGKCGKRLTGSASTGRGGRRYAAYHCRKCAGVRVPVEQFDEMLNEYVERLQWKPELLPLWRAIVLDVWTQEHETAFAEIRRLEESIRDLQKERDGWARLLMEKSIDRESYDRNWASLTDKITLSEAERATLAEKLEPLPVKDVLAFAERVVTGAAAYLKVFGPQQKTQFLQFLFPEGITYENGAVGTAVSPLFFNELQQSDSAESHQVEMAGVEPASEEETSTRLRM